MTRRRRIAVAVSAALSFAPAAFAEDDVLRLGVIGDQTGTASLDAAYVYLERGVDVLNGRDLDLVLHTGDLVESVVPEADMRRDWSRARALLDRLDAPWFLTPGDHDVNPPGRVQNASDRSREALFRTLLADADPAAADGFLRVRDVKGFRIVALYAHETLHADPRWGDVFLATISDAQLSALEAVLTASPAPRGAVVFLHQPLWYNWTGWARVHQVLAEHGVDLVIAGHTHYDQIEPPLDGVTYMIVGAAGGTTKRGSIHAGQLHHVTEIVLGDGPMRYEILALDPAPPQSLTPRAAMDRVQAVAVMLGAVRLSGAVRLEGAECDRLVVAAVGSPIDREVALRVQASGHALEETRFRRGACTTDEGGVCAMPAAYGVSSANNSSVALSSQYETPFLSARLTPPPDGAVEVAFEARFSYGAETYALEERFNLTPHCAAAAP